MDHPDLASKAAEARRLAEFTAAEVTGLPGEIQAKLAARGYKAVAGKDFLQRSDLMGFDSPLAEISLSTLRRRSLGTFFARQSTDKIFNQRKAAAEAHIGSEVDRAIENAKRSGSSWGGPAFDTATGSLDIRFVFDALTKHKAHIGKTSASNLQNATGWFGRTLARASINANTPLSTLDMNPDQILEALRIASQKVGRDPNEWTMKAATTIAGALRKGKIVGYDMNGLQNIEDVILGNGVVRSALKLLSYTDAADDIEHAAAWKRTLGAGNPRSELDLYRNYKRAGAMVLGGVLGGVFAADADQNPALGATLGALGTGMPRPAAAGLGAAVGASQNGVQGALVGAGVGAVAGSGSVANMRTVTRIFAAQMAGRTTQGMTGSDAAGLGAAVAAGTIGMGALRAGATAAVRSGGLLDKLGWANYSKLGDRANQIRNGLRFSLSPIFDAQRYTEGLMLLQTSEFGADIPATLRITKAAENFTGVEFDQIRKEYRAVLAGQGERWMEAIEDTQRFFRDEGILGFSPGDWQAAAWAFIRKKNNLDDLTAAERVRDILTYGTKGRSGFEQSVNFVFFPFSFQKKYLTQLGHFMSEDVGRLMLIHEGLKLYEVLDDAYDLDQMWKDRIPVLSQMRKFNALAMGLSPGEFGGINRPYWDLANELPGVVEARDSIVNLFVPQAMEIRTFDDSKSLVDRVKRVVPIIRDGQDLAEDLMDQGHVLTSPSHLTRAAQARRGWDEFNEVREALKQLERTSGIPIQTMLSPLRPEFADFQRAYNDRVAEIATKYPAWRKARDRSTRRTIEKAQDIKLVRDMPAEDRTQAQEFVLQLDALIRQTEGVTHEAIGADFGGNLDLMPVELQTSLRGIAVKMARIDPSFAVLYDRYFKSTLGPITLGVR